MSDVIDTLIVGAGQAGCEVAFGLRQAGYQGSITLLGDEAQLPYRRPPLSKAYLSDEMRVEALLVKPAPAYDKFRVHHVPGANCVAIEPAIRQVRLADGRLHRYQNLVLATGGRARQLTTPGCDEVLVHYIRTLSDIDQLKQGFREGARLVIIGGGYIGLEAASVAIKKGLKVTVIEAMPRVLERVTAPQMSAFYENYHRAQGVDLRTGVSVAQLRPDDGCSQVVLADGTALAADLIIAGIGLEPNIALAQQAGLEVRAGIVVDQYARTSAPGILAVGDCTEGYNAFLGRHARLESVGNAVDQARQAVNTIMGVEKPSASAPWFWSDQYDLKLQMVGLSQGYERVVVRGDMRTSSFCVFYLKDNVVISADAVNRAKEYVMAKKLIEQRVVVDAALLGDEQNDLAQLLG